MTRVMLGVKNMTQKDEVESVKQTLMAVEGVGAVSAGLDGQASVEYDAASLTIMDLLRALRKEGFVAGMV